MHRSVFAIFLTTVFISWAASAWCGAELDFALSVAAEDADAQRTETLKKAGARATFGGAELDYALVDAAARGDVPRVKALLAAGADPNADVGNGRCSLKEAEKARHVDVALLLRACGAHTGEGSGTELNYALAYASGAGLLDRVDALLDAGADPNADAGGGMTALSEACRIGNPEIVEKLRGRGAVYGCAAGSELDFALADAAASGDYEKARMFLAAGADPDAPSDGCTTILATACRAGHMEVVKLLLNHRATLGQGTGVEINFALADAAAEGKLERVRSLASIACVAELKQPSGYHVADVVRSEK